MDGYEYHWAVLARALWASVSLTFAREKTYASIGDFVLTTAATFAHTLYSWRSYRATKTAAIRCAKC